MFFIVYLLAAILVNVLSVFFTNIWIKLYILLHQIFRKGAQEMVRAQIAKAKSLIAAAVLIVVALAVAGGLTYHYMLHHAASSITTTTTTTAGKTTSIPVSRTSVASYVVVKDALGREVKIRIPVKRIITFYSLAPPFLYLLGAGKEFIAGWTWSTTFYKLIDPNIDKKVAYGRNLGVEQIIKMKPDLVITAKWYANRRIFKQLEDVGIPVLFVNLESVKGIENTIKILGKVLQRESLADKIIQYYNSVLINITNKLKEVKIKPKVLILYYSHKHHSFRTFGGDMFQSKLIEMAGGVSVSQNLTGKKDINDEQIVKWNPDIIIIIRYGGPSGEEVKKMIMNDKALRYVKAVREGHVYVVPNDGENWIDPCPKWVLGLAWLAKTLHPNMFKNLNITSMAATFYKEFFNISIEEVHITGDLDNMAMAAPKAEPAVVPSIPGPARDRRLNG